MILLLDGARGIYIPQQFAEIYGDQLLNVYDLEDDLHEISKGPDADQYWECWDAILQEGEFKDEYNKIYTLAQNGDLWRVEQGEEVPEDFY